MRTLNSLTYGTVRFLMTGNMCIRSINEIVLHYKKRGFWYLGVQMYLKTGSACDYIEYQLNRIHKIKYLFDNQNTKSSLEIDLGQSLEEISGNFRKGHKSDIKKAINFGISVRERYRRRGYKGLLLCLPENV